MVRLAGVLLFAALQGCCMLCTTVRLTYDLQVRSSDGPVAGARVTLTGVEGLPKTHAVTDKHGRCDFFLKDTWEFLSKRGQLGPGFHVSILHPDFIPLQYLVSSKELIRDDSDYSRSEAVRLRRFHFALECDPADQAAAAVPLQELLAKENLKARISPARSGGWRYQAEAATFVPADDSLAVVLLITPGLLDRSPAVLLRLGDSKSGAPRPALIPVILGSVSDERRAAIHANSPLTVHSIAGYDGKTPLTVEQLKGLLETLRRIAADLQR
jgi:hypothetical protein